MGNLQPKRLHVPQGCFVASSEALLMEGALGHDKDVVRQRPRDAMQGPKLVHPGHEHKGDPSHAERATMWNTAKMAVRFAKGASHAVVVDDGCVEALVSPDNLWGGHPPAQSKSSSNENVT